MVIYEKSWYVGWVEWILGFWMRSSNPALRAQLRRRNPPRPAGTPPEEGNHFVVGMSFRRREKPARPVGTPPEEGNVGWDEIPRRAGTPPEEGNVGALVGVFFFGVGWWGIWGLVYCVPLRIHWVGGWLLR